MDDYYQPTQSINRNGFNEVDKFLKDSTSRNNFWEGTLSKCAEGATVHCGTSSFPHGVTYAAGNEKLNDFKHFSAEETPTNLAATSGGGGFYGTVESRDGGVGPAIKSVTSPRQSPKEKSSQQYQSAANSQSRIEETQQKYLQQSYHPDLAGGFSRAEKRRKSSAFKSIRSFFKKHLRLANNNNNTNQLSTNDYGVNGNGARKVSTLSLHDYPKSSALSASAQNLNGEPPSRNEKSNSVLSRAHSFSSSKVRGESTTASLSHSRPTPPSPPDYLFVSSINHNNIEHIDSFGTSPPPSTEEENMQRLRSASSTRCSANSPPQSASLQRRHEIPLPATATRSPLRYGNIAAGGSSYALSSTSPKSNTVVGTRSGFETLPRASSSTTANSRQTILPQSNVKEKDQKADQLETPCLRGIINQGNTCYMNAILQCLACIDQLAEYFVCQHFEDSPTLPTKSIFPSGTLPKKSVTSALSTILQSLWFNVNADGACMRLMKLIASANPHFQLAAQQDAQESLMWILDRIHEEIKDDEKMSRLSDYSQKMYKSEEQLAASDALRRVSGSDRSAIMDLFRAQFRSSMECASCGFSNLTFDPYMSVSLSVPQQKCLSACTALFVPFFNEREIIRYKFNYSTPLFVGGAEVSNGFAATFTIMSMKEKIMRSLNGSPDNLVACQFSPTGVCSFIADDLSISAGAEYVMVEVPKLNEQQERDDLVVAVISHISGFYPSGSRRGQPYVAVLNRQWSYEKIVKVIIEKGGFLLQKPYFTIHNDFKLLLQHPADGVLYLDRGVSMPLLNEWNAGVNLKSKATSRILRLIVEWNSSVANEYLRNNPEPIFNDYSLMNNLTNGATQKDTSSSVTLLNLLQDYIKPETVSDWKCPKCFKSSGKKELKFYSMPPVLIFHLKRFELVHDGATNKVDTRLQIPLDSLDMSPYICNSDSRYNTLKASSRETTNGFIRSKNNAESSAYPLYDLIGIVHHHGERANSGHYTATARNPIDRRWRNFDDLKVTPVQNSADIRSSTDAYLLFYERRSASLSEGNGGTASRWFPSGVPSSTLAHYTEEIRPLRDYTDNIRSSLLNNKKNSADESGNRSMTMPPLRSGASTFYTGGSAASASSSSISAAVKPNAGGYGAATASSSTIPAKTLTSGHSTVPLSATSPYTEKYIPIYRRDSFSTTTPTSNGNNNLINGCAATTTTTSPTHYRHYRDSNHNHEAQPLPSFALRAAAVTTSAPKPYYYGPAIPASPSTSYIDHHHQSNRDHHTRERRPSYSANTATRYASGGEEPRNLRTLDDTLLKEYSTEPPTRQHFSGNSTPLRYNGGGTSSYYYAPSSGAAMATYLDYSALPSSSSPSTTRSKSYQAIPNSTSVTIGGSYGSGGSAALRDRILTAGHRRGPTSGSGSSSTMTTSGGTGVNKYYNNYPALTAYRR